MCVGGGMGAAGIFESIELSRGNILATATEILHRTIPGGSFLIEERTPEEILTPEDFTEEHRQIAQTATRVYPQRGASRGRGDRGQEFRRDPGLAEESGRSGPDGGRHPRGVRRPGHGQGDLGHRCRPSLAAGQLLRCLQRPRRHRHLAHRLVRHRRAEAEIPAPAGHRRVDRRLRSVRINLRLRRHEHPHPRHALRRRQALHAERREDVDLQRRLCRPVHGLRQRSTAKNSPPS